MGAHPVNYVGQRFGILEVLSRAGASSWLCRCDCGQEVLRSTSDLTQTRRKRYHSSCGCYVNTPPFKWAALIRGELRGVRELAKLAGLTQVCIRERMARGETDEARLLRPSRKKAKVA